MVTIETLENQKEALEHGLKIISELIERMNAGEKPQDIVMYGKVKWFDGCSYVPYFTDRGITLAPKPRLRVFKNAAEAIGLVGKEVKDKKSVVYGYIQAVADEGIIYTRVINSKDYRFCNYEYLLHNCTSSVNLGVVQSEEKVIK
jgi:hypothetical protein